MKHYYRGHSLEEVHYDIFSDLTFVPQFKASPRGMLVHEDLAVTAEILDPRDRVIHSGVRAANYGFAVGELCWYLRGDDDLATMRYYNKRMDRFSDDGKTLRSSYGHRIFNGRFVSPDGTFVSQMDMVLEELSRDPDSRRAVLHINEPDDLLTATTAGTKDVPCTLSLQFFVRDARLCLHTTMRSNDLVWGTPYDVFSFTCIQEAVMLCLREYRPSVFTGLELGTYYHTAGSWHIYEQHIEMGHRMNREFLDGLVPVGRNLRVENGLPMAPMDIENLKLLVETLEPEIRNGEWDRRLDEEPTRFPEPFDWMVAQLLLHRQKRLREGERKDERTWTNE